MHVADIDGCWNDGVASVQHKHGHQPAGGSDGLYHGEMSQPTAAQTPPMCEIYQGSRETCVALCSYAYGKGTLHSTLYFYHTDYEFSSVICIQF